MQFLSLWPITSGANIVTSLSTTLGIFAKFSNDLTSSAITARFSLLRYSRPLANRTGYRLPYVFFLLFLNISIRPLILTNSPGRIFSVSLLKTRTSILAPVRHTLRHPESSKQNGIDILILTE